MARTAPPDVGTRQLEAVLALAEYGSFVAAAARLRISQPALTRSIKRLEAQLGVQLFERSTRRVQITAAGREFAAVAERMLAGKTRLSSPWRSPPRGGARVIRGRRGQGPRAT
jgi:DNA-binding transcriptional LysR family regulator